MAVSRSVQEFLRGSEIAYTVLPHPAAYTARQEAAAAKVPERNWAKVVTGFADGEPIQAVVPANCDVDFERLAKLVGVPHIRMATEDELDWLYPDCEPGAMAPLGPLYHQLVYVDERLTADEEVVFNAGSFRDAVAMRFTDFVGLTQPVIGRFARPKGARL
jgi:Ala-tRNA(Pro) deacylase